jgi:hypothetical protein
MSGNLVGIARARELGSPLEEMTSASVSLEQGIAGDARGRKPLRQVTVLFHDGWEDACRDLGAELPWITRRRARKQGRRQADRGHPFSCMP